MQQQALTSFIQLQRGEEIRFNNGESSLFLINSREQRTIEARQKLIELQGKGNRTRGSGYFAVRNLL